MEVDRLVFDAMAHGKPKPQDNQMAKPHPFCQRVEDNAFHLCNSRVENFFARARRSRVNLRDASDGAADGKIKNEKGHAAARAFSRGISLDAVDAHARGKAR